MSLATPGFAVRSLHFNRRHALLLGAGLFVAIFGLEMALLPGVWKRPVSAPAVRTATVDPRLLIRPQTIRVDGALTSSTRLRGTLTPSIPGPNTLRLVVRQAAGTLVLGGRVEIVATMPGMAMVPARATLIARGAGYTGIISLPMFGRYRAQVVVTTPHARYTGVTTLAMPLPSL